jgi:hypothetical protein
MANDSGLTLGMPQATRELRIEASKKANPTELVSVVIGLLHYMLFKQKMFRRSDPELRISFEIFRAVVAACLGIQNGRRRNGRVVHKPLNHWGKPSGGRYSELLRSSFHHSADIRFGHGLNQAFFRDDCRDIFSWGDIEGGVVDIDSRGGRLLAEPMRDLMRGALFDWDFLTGRHAQIEGACRGSDIERNSVGLGQ